MTKWKYLKGSEKDFEGAPEWVTQRIKGDNFPDHSWIGELGGVKLVTTADRADGWWQFNDGCRRTVIAQREPITNVTVNISTPCGEDDLNDCIGSTESLIAERGTRYGKFKDGADIMQSLKDTMRDVGGWNNLTASQKEALDMIQHKIGRILNGDPTYDDSWKDIAGYATLIVNELNEEIK